MRVAIGAVVRTLGGPATYARELVRALLRRRPPDLHYVVLTDGVAELSVVAVPPEVAAQLRIDRPPQIREETPFKPVFQVRSLTEAADAASAGGGGTQPWDTAWDFRGYRRLDGFDPEGNVVQLAERLDHAAP